MSRLYNVTLDGQYQVLVSAKDTPNARQFARDSFGPVLAIEYASVTDVRNLIQRGQRVYSEVAV